jgi:hypothetical protein
MSLHTGNPTPIPGYLLDKFTIIIIVFFTSVKVLWNLFGFEISVIFSVISRLPYYIILILSVSIQFISSWYFESYLAFWEKTCYSQRPLNKTSRPTWQVLSLQRIPRARRCFLLSHWAASYSSTCDLERRIQSHLLQWHCQTTSSGILILCLRISIISFFSLQVNVSVLHCFTFQRRFLISAFYFIYIYIYIYLYIWDDSPLGTFSPTDIPIIECSLSVQMIYLRSLEL